MSFLTIREEEVAFVVSRPEATVTVEALDRLCLDTIARYKRPRAYFFVDSVPKNNYGKVLKTALRQQLAAHSGSHETASVVR